MSKIEQYTDEELLNELKSRNAEVLEQYDSADLADELDSRDWYISESEPKLEDWDDSDIVEYLEKDGYTVYHGSKIADIICDLPSYKLKDLLCDVVGVNHHTSKEDILKLLSEKF